MNTESNYTGERLRFREYYRNLTDNDLARLSTDENLVPAARDAITEELDSRGLELSSCRSRFDEEVAAAKAAGILGGVPSSALATEEKGSHRLLGLAGLAMFGLIGVHKRLLGDATTWRKGTAPAVWLFWALMFTWDPAVRVVKGQASWKVVFWLILGWLYVAAIAMPLAVPAVGRVVADLSPLLIGAAVASPAIVMGLLRSEGASRAGVSSAPNPQGRSQALTPPLRLGA
jgi:hypothetical protein